MAEYALEAISKTVGRAKETVGEVVTKTADEGLKDGP